MTRFVAVGWLVLGLLEVLQSFARLRLDGMPSGDALRSAFTGPGAAYATLALMTPVVFALCRRFPLEPPRQLANAALHVAAGVAFPVVHQALTLGVARLLSGGAEAYAGSLRSIIGHWLIGYFSVDVFRYAAIIAVFHLSRYQQRAASRSLDVERYRFEAESLRATLATAQLEMLTHQLQPHFLFNALNTISGFILREEPERAASLVAHLAKLLRVSLEHSEIEVSLRHELEVVQTYVALEQARFGDRLDVDFDIAEDSLDLRLPSFSLQTTVENAIRHGVAARMGAGRVTVCARRSDDALVVRVSDTGAGFAVDDSGSIVQSGLGLTNTRLRLARLYGSAAELSLRNGQNGGAIVTLRIPDPLAAGAALA